MRTNPRLLPNWSPTLLRAHDELCIWAGKVFSALYRNPTRCLTRRLRVVDQLYNELLSVLAWYSPRQRSSSRRPQPLWWTQKCFSACVAKNGAWRDFQRNPSPYLHALFRAARLASHRTVRSAQRSFWSQWQLRVISLSHSQPDWQLPWFVALSVAQRNHAVINQSKSSGLPKTILLLHDKKRWTIREIILPLLGILLILLMRTFWLMSLLGSVLSTLRPF